MARLFVEDEDRGIHPFLIQTSDERGILPGVTNTCLPLRSGSMLDYSLTTFNNVHIPVTAFLGKSTDMPKDRRALLHSYIWRIPVGTCAIGMPAVLSGKILACIAADYSFRRTVQGSRADRVPIISFRTQALPVLYAIAIAHVFNAWMPRVVDFFTSKGTDFDARTTLGTIFKTTVNRLVTQAARDLGERLGAQGLFPQNHLGIMEVRYPCILLFTVADPHGTDRHPRDFHIRGRRRSRLHPSLHGTAPRAGSTTDSYIRQHPDLQTLRCIRLDKHPSAIYVPQWSSRRALQRPRLTTMRARYSCTWTRARVLQCHRRRCTAATA